MNALNSEGFVQAINSEQPVVVDFWAEWCMPCKMLAPILEEVSDMMDGKAEFYKVNVDDNMAIAQKYGIASIPTVMVYKRGEVVDQMVGMQSKENMIAMVEKHMG